MADFDFVAELGFEAGTDAGDDAETAEAGGFVDKDDLVFGICGIHILIIS